MTCTAFLSPILDEENWKNKNPTGKTIPRSRRALQSMLNPTVQACKNLMLLENGHLSIGKKQSIQTTNTCAFDSLYFVVAGLYADVPDMQEKIDMLARKCKFSQMVVSMFDDTIKMGNKQKILHQQRDIVLQSIFEHTNAIARYPSGLISIDCNANVNFIIQKALPIDLYSYSRDSQCENCNKVEHSTRCFIDINMDLLEQQKIKNLNNCLLETLISEPCNCTCGGKRSFFTKFSNTIIIDLHLKDRIPETSLNEIPQQLNILGTIYNIFGCIEYIGDNDVRNLGHYVSHIRRNTRWQIYDDTKIHVTKSNTNIKIKAQVLFYVTSQKN